MSIYDSNDYDNESKQILNQLLHDIVDYEWKHHLVNAWSVMTSMIGMI